MFSSQSSDSRRWNRESKSNSRRARTRHHRTSKWTYLSFVVKNTSSSQIVELAEGRTAQGPRQVDALVVETHKTFLSEHSANATSQGTAERGPAKSECEFGVETKDDLERNRFKRRLRVGCDVLARGSQARMRTRLLRAGKTVRIRRCCHRNTNLSEVLSILVIHKDAITGTALVEMRKVVADSTPLLDESAVPGPKRVGS